MSNDVFSIDETKDAIAFIASFGNAMGQSLEDGKFELGEYINFIPSLIKLPEAISGINKLPDELRNITDEERAELLAFIKDQLDLPQDATEELLEDSLETAIVVFGYIRKHFLK